MKCSYNSNYMILVTAKCKKGKLKSLNFGAAGNLNYTKILSALILLLFEQKNHFSIFSTFEFYLLFKNLKFVINTFNE